MIRLLFMLIAVVIAIPGQAHELRPTLLQIEERTEGSFFVQWKLPLSLPTEPRVAMPENCQRLGSVMRLRQSDAVLMREHFDCERGISGGRISIDFPGGNPAVATLIQLDLLNGEHHSHLSAPGEEAWQIPLREEPGSVAVDYVLLGIKHIWLGLDHLLFVACLLFIARTPSRLLITITGFTAAHSMTLLLSMLEVVKLPLLPVEAAIALSIVFLACEIVRPRADSWTWRYPVLVSSLFGLLHGFGFASVLSDIGLPPTQWAAALLAFNFGVEIGQLLFVAACLFSCRAIKILPQPARHRLPQLSCYLVGTLASFWLLDRFSGFFV